MTRRIVALAEYGEGLGAAGILFTCSAFGEAIEAAAARAAIPVLKPNEAMFEAALASGRRIGMLATFAPSVASMEDEFRAMAAANAALRRDRDLLRARRDGGPSGRRRGRAQPPRRRGRTALCRMRRGAARAFLDRPRGPAAAAALGRPVLTSPGSAVAKLKAAVAAA